MTQELKARWKASKAMLLGNEIPVPKIDKSGVFRLYFIHRKKISELFDLLDHALDKKDFSQAKNSYDELKGKVAAFLDAADKLKTELLATDKAKSAIVDKVIKNIQGLIMIARADVVTLKDANTAEAQVSEKKLKEWEKKLSDMSKLVADVLLKDLGSIIISSTGAAELMKEMKRELPKATPKRFNEIEAQTKKTRAELLSESLRWKEVDAQAKKLLPALAAYANRRGMEGLAKGDGKVLELAKARATEAEDFIKEAKIKLTDAQAKAAMLAGDIIAMQKR